ncbi:hypothetical protein CDO73_22500 [Saccharibacillus sp. O23]|uniref:DUF4179 domain-containing protein n=1 Tax=Saccharibacillus sp. O23 TaxID=2009338 RepID=UPI000B4E4027|nr:DUF4179 domain-containing protein [Saccharibacillus sp. O23]OWR27394.1 hypothetical protein CDO73_22500 [Saccharibacillus sp. O23]
MTNQEEERKLLRDAETSQRDAEQVGQMRLDEAVRAGIGQGKKRAARRKAVYGTGFAAAAAAAIIALSPALMPGPGAEPAAQNVTAGAPKNEPAAEQAKSGYEKIDDYRSNGTDLKFSSALRNGYVSSLSESQEQNGYTVTLKGMAMDKRGMYMIVSLKNDTQKKARLSQIKVDFGDNYPVTWLSLSSSSGVAPGTSQNFFIENQLDPTKDYPDQARFNVEVYSGEFGQPEGQSTKFDIPFTAATQDLIPKTRTVEVAKELEVDGQKIRIERIEQSPLATYVDYRYEETNSKKIFDLINPQVKLSDESGSDTPLMWREYESENGLKTMVFAASKIQNAESAKLAVEGISAIEPEDLKLVVNTETGEIIQGGDSTLSVLPDKEKGTVTFRRELESEGENSGFSHPTEFEDTFTDAKGTVHDTPIVSEGYSEGSGGKQIESTVYRLSDPTIVQPITFTLKNYWAPIQEKAEVELLTPPFP